MFQCGLSVSYKRILEIKNSIAHNICENSKKEGLLCPTNLKQGVFTTIPCDNIDHNPSWSTSHDSFHGTGMSIFQHLDSKNMGTERDIVPFSEQKDTVKVSLQIVTQPFCQKLFLKKTHSYLKMKIGVWIK